MRWFSAIIFLLLTNFAAFASFERGTARPFFPEATTHAWSNDYDAAGRRTGFHNRRGQPFTFGYDNANRLLSATTPNNRTNSQSYNDRGLVEWVEEPGGDFTYLEYDGRDFKTVLNPHSLEIVTAKVEPSLANATTGERYQFERLSYVALDPKDSRPGALVFNRTITLKDAWAKESAKA